MMRSFCLLLLLCPIVSISQLTGSHIVSGRIISNNIPLSQVSITFKRARKQVITDQNGSFRITTAVFPDTIIVNHTGYEAAIVIFTNNDKPLVIDLHERANMLEEVVVNTGYQTLPKERASGSFAKIDNTLFNRRTSTNVLEHLEGITPGLVFNRNTALSASGKVDIAIRGQSTIFANAQPLIVVDNFPYDGDINNLNAADIESITILKDAAAASIWGARSGNGVIVITTKKGRTNQRLTMDLTANVGFGARPDLFNSKSFLGSSSFIDLEKELFKRGFYDADLTSTARPPVSPVVDILARQRSGIITQAAADALIDPLRGNDIRKDMSDYLYRPSLNQQYALSLRGGSGSTSFAATIGKDANRSVLFGNEYNRTTLSTQLSFIPIKNLTVLAGINYTSSETSNNGITTISAGGPAAKGMVPYASLKDGSGAAAAIVHEYRSGYLDTAGGGQLLDWKYRPLDELNNTDLKTKLNDTRLTLGIKYRATNYLDAELSIQQQNSNTATRNYYSPDSYLARNTINSFSSISGTVVTRPVPTGGILDKTSADLSSTRARGQLNFHKNFGIHAINVLAGAEISQIKTERNTHRYYGYDDGVATSINIDYTGSYRQYISGGTARITNPDALGETNNRYISYYANGAYTYNNLYTLTASARIDKSNLFGVTTNQREVPLYSVGGAWDISKEKFYGLKAVPDLRFRVTYGYNANLINSVTAFTTALYSTNSIFYSGYPYATIINPANSSLRWEKINMLNLAADFGLKNKTVTGTLEFFFKKGTDLAGEAPLAPSTGFTTYAGNYAQTKGNGFELSINTRHNLTKAWQISSYAGLSGVWDKVTDYSVSAAASNYISIGNGNTGNIYPLKGRSVFSLYSYQSGGLNSSGDPQGYLNGKLSTDYQNIILRTTPDSMIYSGNTRPTVTVFFRPVIAYKRFSLSLNLVGKFDYVFRAGTISYGGLYTQWSGHADYEQRWQKAGDENSSTIPALQYPAITSGREQFYLNNTDRVERGDNIRLQDIRLGWTYQNKRETLSPINSVDLFLYLNNPGILWRANKKGIDPDLYGSAMPIPISFTIGCIAHF